MPADPTGPRRLPQWNASLAKAFAPVFILDDYHARKFRQSPTDRPDEDATMAATLDVYQEVRTGYSKSRPSCSQTAVTSKNTFTATTSVQLHQRHLANIANGGASERSDAAHLSILGNTAHLSAECITNIPGDAVDRDA
jgi:hypothetical protein